MVVTVHGVVTMHGHMHGHIHMLGRDVVVSIIDGKFSGMYASSNYRLTIIEVAKLCVYSLLSPQKVVFSIMHGDYC